MSRPSPQALIDAAQAYESLMVPALFGEWAAPVTDAARIRPESRVLDVACGTGILARAIASRMRGDGIVVGLDPHPGMLAVAQRLAPEVQWRRGAAESLPFRDASFDAVVSQFGLMFFGDRHAALREALRVLVRGGRLTLAVWDAVGTMPAYAAEVGLLERIGGRAAADALRAPFVLGDRHELVRMLTDIGFTDVEVSTRRGAARFPSARVMVTADLRGWLPAMGVHLTEETITSILDEADHVLGRWVSPDGTVSFRTSAHVVSGMKP